MAGKRIDDHSSWMGSAGKDMVMPMGVKTKSESSAEGAGAISKYEDTTEEIHAQQEMGIRKAKGHAQKSLHRN